MNRIFARKRVARYGRRYAPTELQWIRLGNGEFTLSGLCARLTANFSARRRPCVTMKDPGWLKDARVANRSERSIQECVTKCTPCTPCISPIASPGARNRVRRRALVETTRFRRRVTTFLAPRVRFVVTGRICEHRTRRNDPYRSSATMESRQSSRR